MSNETVNHPTRPWTHYTPAEADQIKADPTPYTPKGDIYRIGGTVCLLFKAHPNDADPTAEVARLFAAAPDMLDALRGALKWLESDEYQAEGGADDTYMAALRERISITRQAIAKATGEA